MGIREKIAEIKDIYRAYYWAEYEREVAYMKERQERKNKKKEKVQ